MNKNDLAINDKDQDSYLKREQDELINDEGYVGHSSNFCTQELSNSAAIQTKFWIIQDNFW